MNEPSSAGQMIADAASNPKVATVVATATASVGAASQLELIHGFLSLASMTIGLITAGVVLAIQLIKLVRTYKAWRDDEPDPGAQP